VLPEDPRRWIIIHLQRQQNVCGIRYGRSFRFRIIRFRDKTPRRSHRIDVVIVLFKKYNSHKDSFVVKEMCQGPRDWIMGNKSRWYAVSTIAAISRQVFSIPHSRILFYRGRLSRIAVRATNITINWTRRERIMPRRIYAGPTFSLFHLILEPCTTIVSTRRGRAREPRRYQGNRIAAINLVRYNRTKKMRFTFITAISLALMTFTAHVYHITYLPYNPCIIFFVINCRLRFPSSISINW